MEYLVLNAYLKKREQEKLSFITFIKTLKLSYKILFILMFVGAILAIVSVKIKCNTLSISLIYVGIFIELISIFFLTYFMEKDDIKKSDEDIKSLFEKYKIIKSWLKELGYCTKEQIQQLCNRCCVEIEKNQKRNVKMQKWLEKIIALFFVPLYTALISQFLGFTNSIDEVVISIILLGLIVIIICILIYGIIQFFNPFINKTYIEMESMVRMMQGVLDYEFLDTPNELK